MYRREEKTGKHVLPDPVPVDEGPIAAAQVPQIELALAVAHHRVLLRQHLPAVTLEASA
jgi:hypothetical protein